MSRVVFRPEAEADLIAIVLYVSEHDIARAKDLAERLRTRANILATHPKAGRPRPELGADLRGLLETPYVLLYRMAPDAVEIVAVLHTARDLPSAMAARVNKTTD